MRNWFNGDIRFNQFPVFIVPETKPISPHWHSLILYDFKSIWDKWQVSMLRLDWFTEFVWLNFLCLDAWGDSMLLTFLSYVSTFWPLGFILCYNLYTEQISDFFLSNDTWNWCSNLLKRPSSFIIYPTVISTSHKNNGCTMCKVYDKCIKSIWNIASLFFEDLIGIVSATFALVPALDSSSYLLHGK